MKADEVRQIAAWLEAAGLDSFELTTPTARLRLVLGGVVAPVAEASRPEALPAVPSLAARGTGIFLDAHPWSDAPLVRPGQRVRAGDIVALLRTRALIQPVTAAEDGIVGAQLVAPGTMVGFGTPLMEFTPETRSTP
ncbi:acetyl-CoA carboxylase biotin carboxyl carrier protein subunit [Roseomonas terrae]|jgi:acetyl-CoA carboxylase biotin carboxyl carrier protein|uniref:Acetyl-CoA carboxylase biotin carboxyl carrier protein subunit n=1 Tax=Neoroseomonas terrae TaxID=424799 RepID=A0ABS5EBE3_9PROT|nr:acetyl-CoA carboxylase biotin carboxyl carrier protein subunit [Neoroseomonas terrae]MBR0648332.1 acetyl-CoA carboxylase biotin carboxyl carrier protein subunit [Neoroseomonas terrae]